MTQTADIVVAGAGHNSLITAAYLQKAGFECVVLDTRAVAGGGASTEEFLLPGFKIDGCSTGHTLIQANPVIADDELGLIADYGLRYIDPDPVYHVGFPDGEAITMWLDMDRMCEEIARFSRADAEAYRRLIAEYDEVKHIFSRIRDPIGSGPPLEALLAEHPRGRIWMRRTALSAWDVIRREFEDRHVQSFLLWIATQTLAPIDMPGSGLLPYSLTYARQRRSWTIPVGGSGQLTDALIRYIEDRGGTVRCGERVARLLLDGGRCVGVETSADERYMARKAVVSTIHVKHLVEMAPAEAWGEEFVFGIETYDIGGSVFTAYYASAEAPVFETSEGPLSGVACGVAEWPEDLIRLEREIRDGRTVPPPWVLCASPSTVDPTRAPEGQHWFKILAEQSPEPPEGRSWEEFKPELAAGHLERIRRVAPNLSDDVILASLVKSPLDIEADNPHMVRGAMHGGSRSPAFSGANRPVPGWAQHRMPIPGLYQTGATTHPGGSVTGFPGRNAAIVMLQDFGIDPADAMALATPTAGER
jgi:phytoene dehydrogenase-like protein